MSENLRALAVILAVATVVFAFSAANARALATVPGEFERRRNLWFALTLSAFLSNNFWIFCVIAFVLLRRTASKDKDVVGLLMFVLMTLPLMGVEIPGFLGIRYFLKIDYLFLLSLCLLLPAFIKETKKHSLKYFFSETPDRFLYAYLLLNTALLLNDNFSAGTLFTGTLRYAINSFFVAFLPYAIASRLTKDMVSLKAAISSFVVGATVMGVIGTFEAPKGWLLYTNLGRTLGADNGLSIYLRRGDALRAIATAGQAIPYGYVMAVSLILMLGLYRFTPKKSFWALSVAVLFTGMLSAYSRGPWLGASVGFLVFMFTGPQKWMNAGRVVVSGAVLAAVLAASPLGDKVHNALTTESGNYDYRVQVLEVSSKVILENPFFGPRDPDYRDDLEELRQGQGIVDIVNSYVNIALRTGFVGLFLFLGFFLSAMIGIWKRMHSAKDIETINLGRALLATIVCILVTIYTVSGISFIPVIYYLVGGLSVAYVRSGKVKIDSEAVSTEKSNLRGNGRLKRGRYRHRPGVRGIT